MIIKQSTARNLPVLLVDSSDFITGTTGVAFGSATVKYKKEGDSAWTTFVLTVNDWVEIGNGLYEVVFTAAMLDTVGSFNYIVQEANSIDYHGWVDIQANLNDDLASDISDVDTKVDTVDSNIDAVKAKTDNLPSDPTSESNATDNKNEIISEIQSNNIIGVPE